MIRMAYLDEPELNKRILDAYVALMDTKTLRRHWREVRAAIPELKGFHFSMRQLISAPFDLLVEMAKSYDQALSGLSAERKKAINDMLLCKVFNYDGYYQRKKIAPFFREHAEALKLHTCHYCDMAYINTYEYVDRKDGGRRKASHFDLDHILEKSDYPVFAFSLYNLVPSCPVCNERLKGKEPLAKTKKMLVKFSPTSKGFEFDREVRMELLPLGKEVARPFVEHADGYELTFDCHRDKDYEQYVERFRLKERYNYHKGEALRLKDLQMRYPDVNIVNIAIMLKVPFDEVNEDIFGLHFGESQHRCFGKLRKDMMK